MVCGGGGVPDRSFGSSDRCRLCRTRNPTRVNPNVHVCEIPSTKVQKQNV